MNSLSSSFFPFSGDQHFSFPAFFFNGLPFDFPLLCLFECLLFFFGLTFFAILFEYPVLLKHPILIGLPVIGQGIFALNILGRYFWRCIAEVPDPVFICPLVYLSPRSNGP